MADEAVQVGRDEWVAQVAAARDAGFAFFDVLTAVDLEDDGFEVVVRVWDVARRTGRVVTCRVPRGDARLPTITPLYDGAAWHERATAELFGIAFEGHETTHLLLPETFAGHPLRKDFVLAARVAKPWPGAKEPGESDADLAAPRRKRRFTPPGVPSA